MMEERGRERKRVNVEKIKMLIKMWSDRQRGRKIINYKES
jgi:hypothetical protein